MAFAPGRRARLDGWHSILLHAGAVKRSVGIVALSSGNCFLDTRNQPAQTFAISTRRRRLFAGPGLLDARVTQGAVGKSFRDIISVRQLSLRYAAVKAACSR